MKAKISDEIKVRVTTIHIFNKIKDVIKKWKGGIFMESKSK